MSLSAAARSCAVLASLAVLAGCETRGPLAEVESPAALRLSEGQSWYLLGLQMLATREPAQAERAFNRSLASEGVSARALTGLGIATARQGQLARARTHLERARDLAPEDLTVHNNLGVVLYDLGEYHAARQAFRTAFLLSSGASEVAELNLARAEAAIALAQETSDTEDALSHRLQRVGQSEYRLLELESGDGGSMGTGTPG